MFVTKRLLRDLRSWQELEHKNVVPIYGIVRDCGSIVAMVMPDVGDINLTRYLNQMGDDLSPSTRFMLVSAPFSMCAIYPQILRNSCTRSLLGYVIVR